MLILRSAIWSEFSYITQKPIIFQFYPYQIINKRSYRRNILSSFLIPFIRLNYPNYEIFLKFPSLKTIFQIVYGQITKFFIEWKIVKDHKLYVLRILFEALSPPLKVFPVSKRFLKTMPSAWLSLGTGFKSWVVNDVQLSRKDWHREDWRILRNFSKLLKIKGVRKFEMTLLGFLNRPPL